MNESQNHTKWKKDKHQRPFTEWLRVYKVIKTANQFIEQNADQQLHGAAGGGKEDN